MLVAIGLFALKGCNVSILVWIKSFNCFVFGIIAISTARVNYVWHKKITVENATVNGSDVFPWSCFIPTDYP